ncbi:MAG TPA: oligopeptide/dipeptide ABC transporter ATP-binding protein [Paracoccaceae bacterium]|nr:oligopeptide/dipeptide ABC transporter ATP-binding protein [Paracoccaceae bacterium]
MTRPRHPHTLGMLGATAKDAARDRELVTIPGSPPDLRALPPGCSFAPRCPNPAPTA